MRTFGAGIVSLLCLLAIAGCTTNKSIAPITTPAAHLELSVGTINDSAGTLGIGGTTLNVVSSFRNALGNSAYENPGQYSLTGPAGTIVPVGSSPCDRLYSYGDFPGCETDGAGNALWGLPPTYVPPNAVGGYALGFIQTGAPATPGTYTIATAVPVNGALVNYSATASLPSSPIVLPNATGVLGFTSDHKGGGTFTIGNPARPHGVVNPITEYLIFVTNGSLGTVATVETTNTTATIVGTGDCTTSVGGIPIPCGSNTAYVIGADYPLVEAGPPKNTSPTPTLRGSQPTSDITVSPPGNITE